MSRLTTCIAILVSAACTAPTDATANNPPKLKLGKSSGSSVTVTAAAPSSAVRDTTLDIQITGSGFDVGSRASFELHGVADQHVRVNTTTYVKSTQLTANITIAADALDAYYDVAVVTASGKKGIGTEKFQVMLRPTVLDNATGGAVIGVNESGDVVGNINASGSCGSSTVTLPVIWRADNSTVTLPIGSNCKGGASGISRNGIIVGIVENGTTKTAAIWRPGVNGYTMQELGMTPDGKWPYVDGGVNDFGEVVGWFTGPNLYWWSRSTGWVKMQTPNGATACAVFRAINNSGEIAGRCTVNGVGNGYYWFNHASLPQLLPRPAGSGALVPHDINDTGLIVGYITSGKAVAWDPGVTYTVRVLPDAGYGATAMSVASDGTIAGSLNRSSNGPLPVFWRPAGSYQILGTTKPNASAEASDVANGASGLIVAGHENVLALRWRSDQ